MSDKAEHNVLNIRTSLPECLYDNPQLRMTPGACRREDTAEQEELRLSAKMPTVGRKGRVVEMPKRSQKNLWVEELPQWRERQEEKQLETGFGEEAIP